MPDYVMLQCDDHPSPDSLPTSPRTRTRITSTMSPSRMTIPMRELDLVGLCPVRALSESSDVESESGVCGPVGEPPASRSGESTGSGSDGRVLVMPHNYTSILGVTRLRPPGK